MSDMAKTAIITAPRRRIFEADADTINYWRRNPIVACRDILGIELTDYQKYQLQNLWTASHSVLCCGRNTGKSFVGGIFLILWALLYNRLLLTSVDSFLARSRGIRTRLVECVFASSRRALREVPARGGGLGLLQASLGIGFG